jgi:NAD(P)-dependent dehydrogenase (short-subunit alcohol dehydrogenase family)
VDEVGERLGPVDILVLNASTEVRRNWLDIDRSDFKEQVAVNLRASFVLLQATVPAMAQRGWGRVISIGSLQEKSLIPPSWSTRPSRARSSTWF